MTSPARTPEPPYVAVIFTNTRTGGDEDAYGEMAARMVELARQQDGFLGIDTVTGADGLTITNSYWRDHDVVVAWKANVEHLAAQKMGREKWYQTFSLRVATVERAYGFERG